MSLFESMQQCIQNEKQHRAFKNNNKRMSADSERDTRPTKPIEASI
jgi:hypothetical protein